MQQRRTGRVLAVLVSAAGAAVVACSAGAEAAAEGWDTHGDRTVRALAGNNETHVPNILRTTSATPVARLSLVANQAKSAHETRGNTVGNLS